MNPITHVYVALELFKNESLTPDEIDHLIVGSILPDINESGLIHYHKTHSQALNFFNSTNNRLHKIMALGMVLHGEEPIGLDYYAHNENGFIENNRLEVTLIAKKYEKQLGKISGMTAHHLVEFSTDNILAEKNPKIIPAIVKAFKNPKIKKAITNFSSHFDLEERKNYKIIKLFSNKHLLKFFQNFQSINTVSKSWANFTFFLNLQNGRSLTFREKFKKLTNFSYYNIKRKFHEDHLTIMFHEINQNLEKPALSFISKTTNTLKPLKNDLYKQLQQL